MTIHHVDAATSEDWRSRGAPLSGTDATALGQARRALAAEAARLHNEAAKAGADPEALREAQARATGRPIDCDPGMVPPEMADEECDLADELERRGVPVTPLRAQRQRRLSAALRRLRC